MSPARTSAILLACALGAAGCGSCKHKPDQDGGAAAQKGTEEEAAELGVVEGVVRLADDAELPAYPLSVLGFREDGPGTPEGCPAPDETWRQPMALGKGRGLSNVLVSVTEFESAPEADPTEHHVTIRGCRLTPPIVAATRGDVLVVTSESDYPFLARLGASQFMPSVMKGQTRTFPLDRGGVQGLTCDLAAPCGRTDVVVQYHPVHGLTGKGGAFRLDNVPPGKKLRVHAWHPLLEEASTEVAVERGQPARVTLTLSPADELPFEPDAEESLDGGEPDPETEAEELL